MSISLRPVAKRDLPLIESWLREPHVATWWLTTTTIEDELADIDMALAGAEAFEVLVVECQDRPVGWCQWYRWWDHPKEAAEVGASKHDLGIDYSIGEPSATGKGIGTELIAELVRYLRTRVSSTGIVVEPDARNHASRRILEKNGFELVDERKLSFEAEDRNAIYRLALP